MLGPPKTLHPIKEYHYATVHSLSLQNQPLLKGMEWLDHFNMKHPLSLAPIPHVHFIVDFSNSADNGVL